MRKDDDGQRPVFHLDFPPRAKAVQTPQEPPQSVLPVHGPSTEPERPPTGHPEAPFEGFAAIDGEGEWGQKRVTKAPTEKEERKAHNRKLPQYRSQKVWVGNRPEIRCIGRYCFKAPGVASVGQFGRGDAWKERVKGLLASGNWVLDWIEDSAFAEDFDVVKTKVFYLRPRGSEDKTMESQAKGVCCFFNEEGTCSCDASVLPAECQRSKRVNFPDFFTENQVHNMWVASSETLRKVAKSARTARTVVPVEFSRDRINLRGSKK